MNYEQLEKNYVRGLWNKAMMRTAVRKGVITAEQYQEITGDVYGGASAVSTADLDAAYQKGVQEA